MFTMKFIDYKDKFEKVINDEYETLLKDQKYNKEKVQELVNVFASNIIEKIHTSEDFKGYKVLCSATIIQKAGCCTNFASSCLYNPMCDGSTLLSFETETFHTFVCLYAVIN